MMVGPMAGSPTFDPCAYEPPVSVWRLVEQNSPEHERQELKQVLGESMVDQSLELHEEVDTLLEIWRDYRCETYSESYKKHLPEPPEVRDRLQKEIKFLVENLRERANRHGIDPDKVFASHNKDVLDYAIEKANKEMTPSRPSTAVSRQGRETPMVMSPSSDRMSLASTISDEVEGMNEKLNILQVDEVIQGLRSTLEDEVSQLVSDINFLQSCLEEEADYRCETSGNHLQEPSITELREERTSLEKDLLKCSPPLPSETKPALPPQLRKYTPLPKGVPSVSSVTSVTGKQRKSPVKASHSLRSPESQIPFIRPCHNDTLTAHGATCPLSLTLNDMSDTLSKMQVVTLSDMNEGHGNTKPLIPSPPQSNKPKLARPGSADRFRKMVFKSRDG